MVHRPGYYNSTPYNHHLSIAAKTMPQYVALVKAVGGSTTASEATPPRFSSLADLASYLYRHPELGVKTPAEKAQRALNIGLIGWKGGCLVPLEEGIKLIEGEAVTAAAYRISD
ncbi:hypothetical protein HYU40_01905 [Candidatus Woesearchaeota archaeon]|nr:hypothetical protein [Candidatus Woesearchaeota archaeon]